MNMPENAQSPLASQLKLDAHWMPYTANRNFQRDPRLIVGAEGSWLIDDKGRKVLIPAAQVAYVDLGAEHARAVGFGALTS